MKKSLIALAVIAASGAAMAQSSVTMYGLVDMYVGSVKVDNGTTSLRQTKVESGLVNTSRFGLKGSEDLGNGLAANFVLEQGIAADTGASKTATLLVAPAAGTSFAFSRQAWVGLSGSFGSTRIGLTPTPFDDVSGQYDAVFDSALSPMNSVFASANSYLVRPGNTIAYYTPNLSGFSASASYSLGENKANAAAAVPAVGATPAVAAKPAVNAGSVYSLALAYANGPIGVSLGYQNEKVDSSALARKYTRLGGSYDFGMAKLYANYGRAENYEFSTKATLSGAKATDYQVGVDVPVGAALTLSASYAQSKDNATAGNDKRKGFGLGAKYALSKRTALYGGYEADESKLTGANTTKHDLFAVGVQHRF